MKIVFDKKKREWSCIITLQYAKKKKNQSTWFDYHSWVEEASFSKALLSSYLPNVPRLGCAAAGGSPTMGPAL